MGRRLALAKSEITHVNFEFLGAARLRVEASDPEATGADADVFLYLRRPPSPYDGSVVDEWLGVAGPVDVAEYPAGQPDSRSAYPLFRLNYFEVDLRSSALVGRVWETVVREVGVLLAALDRLEDLVPTATVTVGTPGGGGSGSSGSSAAP